jgi:hypothetical protein
MEEEGAGAGNARSTYNPVIKVGNGFSVHPTMFSKSLFITASSLGIDWFSVVSFQEEQSP